MSRSRRRTWHKRKKDIRNRLISGMFLLVPFGVTLLVMRWLFRWLVGALRPIVDGALGALLHHPAFASIPQAYVTVVVYLLTIGLLLVLLYLFGAAGQFVIGKRLVALAELIVSRIPLVRSIYGATKQVITAISGPKGQAFKSVVIVEFPRPGFKAIGFLTGTIKDARGREYCKVLIPTTPNPTTGFLELVPTEEVMEAAMTVDEAFRMIISGGIVSSETLLPQKRSNRERGRSQGNSGVALPE